MESKGKGTLMEARIGFSGWLLRVAGFFMVHLAQRPKHYGVKPNIDKPVIFACRHVGMIDSCILMGLYPWKALRPLAAKDYVEKNFFTRWFFTNALCIPIDRRDHSPQWLDDAMKALEKGQSIIIYPEGHRNHKDPGLLPFKRGVAVLAARSGVPVVPVYNAMWNFPKRYRYAVGEPFHIDPAPAAGITPEWLDEQASKIRDKVAELEPLLFP